MLSFCFLNRPNLFAQILALLKDLSSVYTVLHLKLFAQIESVSIVDHFVVYSEITFFQVYVGAAVPSPAWGFHPQTPSSLRAE